MFYKFYLIRLNNKIFFFSYIDFKIMSKNKDDNIPKVNKLDGQTFKQRI